MSLSPPVVVVAYAAINSAAASRSMADLLAKGYASGAGPSPAAPVHSMAIRAALIILVLAAPLVVYGAMPLLGRRPDGPGPGITVLLSAPYLLTLLFFTLSPPMSHGMYADDQSGIVDGRPGWYDPALWALWLAAAAVQVAVVVRLLPGAPPRGRGRGPSRGS